MNRCRGWIISGLIRQTKVEAKELLVRLKLFLGNWLDSYTGKGSQSGAWTEVRAGRRTETEAVAKVINT